ncbi:MAG: phosphate acyltransferase PlsX [Chitinophagaceae bacterium]
MNIGLDMMGGDFAPEQAVKGMALFLFENNFPVFFYLFGDEFVVKDLLSHYSISPSSYRIIHADEEIEMHALPTKALRERPQSSMALGFKYLADGKVDAFISAGNTGAMMVGSLFSIKAIEGVLRPTIPTILPQESGRSSLLLDVGLNADCKPEHLNQFAILGSLYAQHILGIAHPGVGLINIGEEEGKGNLLTQSAYPLLRQNSQISFVGNLEGRDILTDKADVMVCDGFTGNVVLKLVESLYEISHRKEIHHEFFLRFNFENYGGTPVLGINKPVIVGHGISHSRAFMNMIVVAVKMIQTDLLNIMKLSFNKVV